MDDLKNFKEKVRAFEFEDGEKENIINLFKLIGDIISFDNTIEKDDIVKLKELINEALSLAKDSSELKSLLNNFSEDLFENKTIEESIKQFENVFTDFKVEVQRIVNNIQQEYLNRLNAVLADNSNNDLNRKNAQKIIDDRQDTKNKVQDDRLNYLEKKIKENIENDFSRNISQQETDAKQDSRISALEGVVDTRLKTLEEKIKIAEGPDGWEKEDLYLNKRIELNDKHVSNVKKLAIINLIANVIILAATIYLFVSR